MNTQTKQFIRTNEKIEVLNYPYGFKLRTTLYDSIEFNPKKGYRHITQTICPKKGRLNAPKKSTYSMLIVRYYDEIGHIKSYHFDFNGKESINKGCKFINDNFELFTPEEITYLYSTILTMLAVDLKASIIYGGAKLEDLKPLYTHAIESATKGIKQGGNLFNEIILDTEKIKSFFPENYNPFTIKEYTIN
jgi:hypothetical protein